MEMNTEQKFCQSCGMPMGADDEMFGTEANGNKSEDYCKYCYEAGAFTSDISMGEMIELCVPHMATPESGMSADAARGMMNAFLPNLKRWAK